MTPQVWNFNWDLWSGPCIGVGFEYKLLLLPVYTLFPIDFELTGYPIGPNESYASFISTTSIVSIFSLLKYKYHPHQVTIIMVL